MLALPPRGDRIARRWAMFGIVAYILLAVVLLGVIQVSPDPASQRSQFAPIASMLSLVGLGAQPNYVIFLLVISGVYVTLYASYRIQRDIRDMAREERDIEWVQRRGREGLPLVFAKTVDRDELFEQGIRTIPDENVSVETLVDDRVRRIHAALSGPGTAAVSPEYLKAIAEARTMRYGSFARYASSLLLLLAVLGTFAGVKTALPSLIDALGQDAKTSLLISPLTAIASAFGGNALALVGAIAIGVMAQGVGLGRRNLLERLELVSAEHIYGEGTTETSNPLQAAVNALRDTANQIHAATGRMTGIEGGLRGLSNEFKTSFEILSTTLTEIADRQEEGLHDRTSASLDALQLRVADLAKSVEATALVHSQITAAVQDRAEESRAAIGQMKLSNDRLSQALDAFLRVGELADRSFGDISTASKMLAAGSQGVQAQMQGLTEAVGEVRPGLEGLQKAVAATVDQIRQEDTRSLEAWRQLSGEISAHMREAMVHLRAPAETARLVREPVQGQPVTSPVLGGSPDRETLALLRKIAQSTETLSSTRHALVQTVAVAGAAGVLGGAVVLLLMWLF
jgi:hypothetical protein